MNISREEKKAEAIARMKAWGICGPIVKQFEDKDLVAESVPPVGACFWLKGEQLKRVREFEKENGESCPINIRDYLHGEPLDSLGEAIALCDDTEILTYGDDGEKTEYVYYPPTMPWQRCAFDPTSIGEVHRRIIKAVQKLTDMTSDEIEGNIDDYLNVVGCSS